MKNIGQMMKQAQMMQTNLKKAQEEIALLSVEGSSGNDLVKVTLGGDRLVKQLSVDNSVIVDNRDMLEDLLILAFNSAMKKLEAISQEKMSSVTAGMPLPPGLKF